MDSGKTYYVKYMSPKLGSPSRDPFVVMDAEEAAREMKDLELEDAKNLHSRLIEKASK